jgi:thiamine-phosphate pyrophosphorylase
MKGYYFITDSGLSKAGNASDCRQAVSAGVEVIQYRRKQGCSKDLCEEALKLRKICSKTVFLVNDRVDIALGCKADGVHLGQDDLPCALARKLLGKNKIIGVTVHSAAQARKAEKDGANYVAVAPVFATGTKKDAGRAVGMELVRAVKKSVRLPVVAIGGINLHNAAEVIASGADCVCAISCVVTKPSVKQEIRRFQRLFKE